MALTNYEIWEISPVSLYCNRDSKWKITTSWIKILPDGSEIFVDKWYKMMVNTIRLITNKLIDLWWKKDKTTWVYNPPTT